ncbi:DUF1289 domain-containing protein [Rheinheimera sp. UJ63]|uniref:DUF1289 domain-containing protein n=1 Tax=Rheinheimera sp. UJ63 TaxID=2910157 RepID=UPI001F1A3DC6|nr:DUF1289 domain-containing protein [Rheinheimera sp. UJ63]MCF4008895.1 DUF1289 domain-containing protein [Rheinheimera sp. UJ63]
MTISSPCVACCKLDEHKVCVGCYRHINEIVDWNRQSEADLVFIMQKVALRREHYQQQDANSIATSPITQAEWQAAKAQRK